ncbi:MAG TPA: family 43 glycosylhydrolase, partial [Saccharofermentans sp.]|nr:family 43 glycosylhydrolase [Saccharofermentans sp.]
MSNNSQPKTPLVTNIFTADPSAHVFDGKIYIYPSHDIPHDGEDNDNGDEYRMEDYHILSLDDITAPCVDNGEALHLKDIPWASKQLWAPDAIERNGTYYLFFPARDMDGIFRIGVATSSSPVGPFKAEAN